MSYKREPFNEALIPSTLTHERYYVAHINSLQALVIVEHTVGQFNLYLSDITGVYFSLSLPDIVLVNGYSELQLIEGVNGTMIANQYVREDPSESNPPLRTLITLDNGGTWELLRAPTDPANPCEPPLCSLHFHMDSSEYWRLGVYSDESAPGIIVAHGEYCAISLSNLCTWTSSMIFKTFKGSIVLAIVRPLLSMRSENMG